MPSVFESIQSFDQSLFVFINRVATHPFLDTIMPFFRESTFWIPLYLFIIVFVFVNFGKKGWAWLLFALLTVLLTDQTSSGLIKNGYNAQGHVQILNFSVKCGFYLTTVRAAIVSLLPMQPIILVLLHFYLPPLAVILVIGSIYYLFGRQSLVMRRYMLGYIIHSMFYLEHYLVYVWAVLFTGYFKNRILYIFLYESKVFHFRLNSSLYCMFDRDAWHSIN